MNPRITPTADDPGGEPCLITIDRPDDPRLAGFLNVRDRDLAHARGRLGGSFIVEGKVTLEALLSAGRFTVEAVLLARNRLPALTGALRRLPPGTPVYLAPQDALDAAVGFHLHRGVLALARRGDPLDAARLIAAAAARPQAALLALVGLSNHDNVGAAFRNAAAFGAACVLLDGESCDPLYRKAIRVSAGAALHVPFARIDDPETLARTLIDAGFEVWTLTPRAPALLARARPPAHVALMLGPEGPGLPASLIARGRALRIDMADGVDSLNVATAGAVALAHVFNAHVRNAHVFNAHTSSALDAGAGRLSADPASTARENPD